MRHLRITFNGSVYDVGVEDLGTTTTAAAPPPPTIIQQPLPPKSTAIIQPTQASAQDDRTKKVVASPMPGRIISVNARVGDTIQEGDVVAILEAMKLENEIVSDHSGIVQEICVSADQVIDTDDPIMIIH